MAKRLRSGNFTLTKDLSPMSQKHLKAEMILAHWTEIILGIKCFCKMNPDQLNRLSLATPLISLNQLGLYVVKIKYLNTEKMIKHFKTI